jgi:hypothetical protein
MSLLKESQRKPSWKGATRLLLGSVQKGHKEISARYRKFLAEQSCDDTATTIKCEMPTHDGGSQDSPQETQAPFVSAFSARPGVCELLFVSNQNSPQQLVAMVTGLSSSLSTKEVYPTQHIFDMELDERLKVFPGKIQIMPCSQHLVAEVHRRSPSYWM